MLLWVLVGCDVVVNGLVGCVLLCCYCCNIEAIVLLLGGYWRFRLVVAWACGQAMVLGAIDVRACYQNLPPDKALAALATEDKKRQYATTEKYVDDVLQSVHVTSDVAYNLHYLLFERACMWSAHGPMLGAATQLRCPLLRISALVPFAAM
ncbi:hypothetical protein U1Q18_050056 [Sarracenia purpurea var. burkii]